MLNVSFVPNLVDSDVIRQANVYAGINKYYPLHFDALDWHVIICLIIELGAVVGFIWVSTVDVSSHYNHISVLLI